MFIRQNIFCATFGRRKLTNRQVQEGVFEQMLYFELSMIKLFYSGILAIHILVESLSECYYRAFHVHTEPALSR